MIPAQAITEIQEILDSIVAIKGPTYMQLVAHSINTTNIMRSIDDLAIKIALASSAAAMMGDIATLAKIDITSPGARKEFEADVRAAANILEKIKPPH